MRPTKLISELQNATREILIAASASDARNWETVYSEISALKARCDEILRCVQEEEDQDAATADRVARIL